MCLKGVNHVMCVPESCQCVYLKDVNDVTLEEKISMCLKDVNRVLCVP